MWCHDGLLLVSDAMRWKGNNLPSLSSLTVPDTRGGPLGPIAHCNTVTQRQGARSTVGTRHGSSVMPVGLRTRHNTRLACVDLAMRLVMS